MPRPSSVSVDTVGLKSTHRSNRPPTECELQAECLCRKFQPDTLRRSIVRDGGELSVQLDMEISLPTKGRRQFQHEVSSSRTQPASIFRACSECAQESQVFPYRGVEPPPRWLLADA